MRGDAWYADGLCDRRFFLCSARERSRRCGGAGVMRRLGILALVIVLLIGAAVLFYKAVFPTYSYRYRMTVEVTVDGVVHSSSSVIEVRLRKQPQVFVPVPPVIAMVRGEAVFVDLGQGRNVIALLASGPNGSNVNYPSYIVSQHFKLSMVDY
jgi:hypothetical protein